MIFLSPASLGTQRTQRGTTGNRSQEPGSRNQESGFRKQKKLLPVAHCMFWVDALVLTGNEKRGGA